MIIWRTIAFELWVPESLIRNLEARGFWLSHSGSRDRLWVEVRKENCSAYRDYLCGSTGGIRLDIIEALNGRVKPEDIPRILVRDIDSSDTSHVTHYRQVLGTFRRAIYEALLEVGYERDDTEEVRGDL